MSRLNKVDPALAQGRAKDLLDAVQQNLGATPNLMRIMANQPAVLGAFLANKSALAEGALTAQEAEAIALAVAAFNGCEYCASAHTFIAKSHKVDEVETLRNLRGRSDSTKTQAILTLVIRALETRGNLADDDISAAKGAGLDDAVITEVVAHIAANIFTNYLNNVARTEIDFPVVDLDAAKAA